MNLDRRSFAHLASAFLAFEGLVGSAAAQQHGDMDHPAMGQPTPGADASRPAGTLTPLTSGVFTPGPEHGAAPDRKSRRYLAGLLTAGNIQMEIHETHQEPGAVHEKSDKHLHNEIWLVREGLCELTTNGVTRRMGVGDVGLCCAGDQHYIRNAGTTGCTYFVVTVGPPEPPSGRA